MRRDLMNDILRSVFGQELPGTYSAADLKQINEDGALMHSFGGIVPRLTKEEIGTLMDGFEYITPTGLNCRPLPADIRAKLKEIVQKYKPH